MSEIRYAADRHHVAFREAVDGITVMVAQHGNRPTEATITLVYALEGVETLTVQQMEQLADVLTAAAGVMRESGA